MRILTVLAAAVLCATPLAAQAQAAVATDPPRDSANPARMEVLHIPSGTVNINGLAYVASGAGAHPTLVLLHGLPGNEKNLDLAQAVRRAGWTVITFNYRGSWGSPGVYRFAQNLEDADAVLAFLRDAATARALGVDTMRVVMGGHSMGGWVTAIAAAHHPELAGAILISAADMGALGGMSRADLSAFMADNLESLAGVTGESMADELIANGDAWSAAAAASRITRVPMLVVTSDDGLAEHGSRIAAAARAAGNRRITAAHMTTDHSYSDHRIALESAVIDWLNHLPSGSQP